MGAVRQVARPLLNRQTVANSTSKTATIGPVRRSEVSRHTAKRRPPSMYSWPMFMPPVYTATPSMRAIFMWLR